MTLQNTSPDVLWDSHFFDSAVVTLLDSRKLSNAEDYKSTEHFIIPWGEYMNKHKVTRRFTFFILNKKSPSVRLYQAW